MHYLWNISLNALSKLVLFNVKEENETLIYLIKSFMYCGINHFNSFTINNIEIS